MKNTLMLLFLAESLTVSAGNLRVMFYNVENFFDTRHDAGKNDRPFTPEGDYHWTERRFQIKAAHISQVLAAAGEKGYPDLIGMAEIENEAVIRSLMRKAGMESSYRYVHYESPDQRGIDVCLIYNRYRFNVLESRPVTIRFDDGRHHTRDILYVKGRSFDRSVWHLFVCHFPSRSGGQKASEPLRCRAADCLRRMTDSILTVEPRARLLIMGDFNDEPSDISLSEHLGAVPPSSDTRPASGLYNLTWPVSRSKAQKSYKYHGSWSMLDQFIVSERILKTHPSVRVLSEDFMLETDDRYLGRKPFRTFSGYSYLGGYSDHLPIVMDLRSLP